MCRHRLYYYFLKYENLRAVSGTIRFKMQMIRPLSWEFSPSRSELVSGNWLYYKGVLQAIPSSGHIEDTARLSENIWEEDECPLPLLAGSGAWTCSAQPWQSLSKNALIEHTIQKGELPNSHHTPPHSAVTFAPWQVLRAGVHLVPPGTPLSPSFPLLAFRLPSVDLNTSVGRCTLHSPTCEHVFPHSGLDSSCLRYDRVDL